MTEVPCNGCRACCHDTVWLMPDDDASTYDHVTTKIGGKVLRRRADGSCVYLEWYGCAIHDRAPQMCKKFDCRVFYMKLTKEQRTKALKRKENKEIFAAAKRLMGLT